MCLIAGTLASSLPVRRAAFCRPAAHLAGVLSGAPCVRDGDDVRLTGAGFDLIVVPDCAAADFFSILAGFLSLLVYWRGFRTATQLLVLPAAWIATVALNSLRLIACWQTDRLAQALLPNMLWPATHMAVGLATFLTGLTVIFWLMTLKRGKDMTDEHNTG
jgi:exosortase/archaeosortase family protein